MWIKSVVAPAGGALGLHAGAVERATTAIGCDVNKPVKSSLHFKRVKRNFTYAINQGSICKS